MQLDVGAPTAVVRPTEVLDLAATVSASGDEPVRHLAVCTEVPDWARTVRAPGAAIGEDEACWRQPRLRAGAERHFRATVRVKASARGRLRTMTTVRAGNAPTRRLRRTLVIRSLPATACARLSVAAEPTATASC